MQLEPKLHLRLRIIKCKIIHSVRPQVISYRFYMSEVLRILPLFSYCVFYGENS